MGVKRGNLKLISGLLLLSFILNYILIRVKKEGLNKENRKNKRKREKVERGRGSNERKNTKLWGICLLDH